MKHLLLSILILGSLTLFTHCAPTGEQADSSLTQGPSQNTSNPLPSVTSPNPSPNPSSPSAPSGGSGSTANTVLADMDISNPLSLDCTQPILLEFKNLLIGKPINNGGSLSTLDNCSSITTKVTIADKGDNIHISKIEVEGILPIAGHAEQARQNKWGLGNCNTQNWGTAWAAINPLAKLKLSDGREIELGHLLYKEENQTQTIGSVTTSTTKKSYTVTRSDVSTNYFAKKTIHQAFLILYFGVQEISWDATYSGEPLYSGDTTHPPCDYAADPRAPANIWQGNLVTGKMNACIQETAGTRASDKDKGIFSLQLKFPNAK